MKYYKVISTVIGVYGLSKQMYKPGQIVSEKEFAPGQAEKLTKRPRKFLEPYVKAEKKGKAAAKPTIKERLNSANLLKLNVPDNPTHAIFDDLFKDFEEKKTQASSDGLSVNKDTTLEDIAAYYESKDSGNDDNDSDDQETTGNSKENKQDKLPPIN